MSKKLRGVILGIDGVLAVSGSRNQEIYKEMKRLVRFMLSKGLQPVVLANRDWSVTKGDGTVIRLEDEIRSRWFDFPWFVMNRMGLPHKPSSDSINYVLNQMGWDPTETVYVGNTDDDMRTAVNGNVLFLNGTWFGKRTDYGFEFSSPRDIARFIDIFCLREHLWHFCINEQGLEYYALAPYSTYKQEFAAYSTDAKQAAKWGAGHPDFWTKYLFSTIYFSELHKRIDYVAVYPGHEAGFGNPIMEEPTLAFTKCFRKSYLRDLVVRHTPSRKSSFARVAGQPIDHLNQLNTLVLTRYPLRGTGDKRYVRSPLTDGKTVLIVDDICTNGYSLEAARSFLEQTGVRVICLSWLKTINTNYQKLEQVAPFSPFEASHFNQIPPIRSFPYHNFVVDPYAPEEIDQKLSSYDNWNWPDGI